MSFISSDQPIEKWISLWIYLPLEFGLHRRNYLGFVPVDNSI